MQKKIIKNLKCPNSGKSNLSCFGTNVSVEDKTSMMLSFDEINEEDDIYEGILFDENYQFVYPIKEYITTILSIGDSTKMMLSQLESFQKKQLPGNLNSTIEQNIKLIKNKKKDYVNIWNNEESDYYNKGHESNEKIKKFAYNAINNPYWIRHESQNKSVFYELKKINIKEVLEVGSAPLEQFFIA